MLGETINAPVQQSQAPIPSSVPVQDAEKPVTLPTLETPSPSPVSRVVLETSKGSMTIELYPEDAPKTVANFLDKMRSGEYANRIFHRVEDWVIQGGDPLGNGTGGGTIPTELSKRMFDVGSVGAARGNMLSISNADQFFICSNDCSWLTEKYTNFGKVIQGMEVAKKIQKGDVILSVKPAPAAAKVIRKK